MPVIQLPQQESAAADGQHQRPFDQPGDAERAQRQRGCRHRMATTADSPLDPGCGPGDRTDDTVDRGTAHGTRGLGGRFRGPARRSSYGAYGAVNDTHDDSLMIGC